MQPTDPYDELFAAVCRRLGQDGLRMLRMLRHYELRAAGIDLDEAFFRTGIERIGHTQKVIAKELNISEAWLSELIVKQTDKDDCDRLADYLLTHDVPFRRASSEHRLAIAHIAMMRQYRKLLDEEETQPLTRQSYELVRRLAKNKGWLLDGLERQDSEVMQDIYAGLLQEVKRIDPPYRTTVILEYCKGRSWGKWTATRVERVREFSDALTSFVDDRIRRSRPLNPVIDLDEHKEITFEDMCDIFDEWCLPCVFCEEIARLTGQ